MSLTGSWVAQEAAWVGGEGRWCELTYPWAVAEVVWVGDAEHICARLVVVGGDAPYLHFTVLDNKCGRGE